MSNVHDIPDLDRRGLREFGLLTGAILAGLFGLFFPWVLNAAFPLWPWLVAGGLGAWALVSPGTMRPIYRGWMKFGLLLSRITTPIILGLVFFVVITPVALVMKLIGRDAMARKFDADAKSYRVESRRVPAKNLERPY